MQKFKYLLRPDKTKIPKILYTYPKYIFQILKFYSKLKTITKNPNPNLKISVIPKIYSKYPNIPNNTKHFGYFDYPIESRIELVLEQRPACPKYTIGTFSLTQSRREPGFRVGFRLFFLGPDKILKFRRDLHKSVHTKCQIN